MDSLQKAIEIVGGPSKMAEILGFGRENQPRVSNWRRRGIPRDMIIPVSRATGFEVKPYDLNPILYPDPHWIPPEALSQPAESQARG